MKNQNKGFTFKVAANKDVKGQVKAREGVAIAGCTRVTAPWGGTEAKTHNPYTQVKDDGYWC